MDIAILMGLFFLGCTAVFVFIAIFLPEWVGITGKKARQINQDQQQQQDPTPTPLQDPTPPKH